MASTSEVGHARNVANFYDLISAVTGYGPTYNPTKDILKLPQLNTLYAAAHTQMSDVMSKSTAYNKKVNERLEAFSDVKPTATRVLNALDATDASPQTMADAKSFAKKLRGKRTSAATTPISPDSPAPATISASQQSYDQQIQHFAGLVSVAGSESTYIPNEDALKITTLNAKTAGLTTRNNQVADAYTQVSNARILRNKTLYDNETGLVAVAAEVKKYVKSLYGANSPEYAQIKGLQFKQRFL